MIADANVLIDLDKGGILAIAARFTPPLRVPDLVAHELNEPNSARLLSLGYQLVSLSGQQVAMVGALRTNYLQLSIPDLFALVAAKTGGETLLTGDRNLRTAASTEGVTVHGTLWVLEGLVQQTLLTHLDSARALSAMLTANRRLPIAECNALLRKWTGSAPGTGTGA